MVIHFCRRLWSCLLLQSVHQVGMDDAPGFGAEDVTCQHGGGMVFLGLYFRIIVFQLRPSWAFQFECKST